MKDEITVPVTIECVDLSNVRQDSIIIVRGVSDRRAREQCVEHIKSVVQVNAVILVFGNQSASLEIVPESKMNEFGWHRSRWKDALTGIASLVKKRFPLFGVPEYARGNH